MCIFSLCRGLFNLHDESAASFLKDMLLTRAQVELVQTREALLFVNN